MLKKLLNNKGVSLAELLIVVIIVISISAISFNYYKLSLEKSKVSEALSVLRKISDAQIIYYRENRCFTEDASQLLVNFGGEIVEEGGYKWIKNELFLYRPNLYSLSDSKIATALRKDKYEIYAIYDKETESLKFDADATTFNDTSFFDRKIVEAIQKNGKL
ncbi:MAG: hypothetical protein IKN62_02615 [Elusimicrobia bacterium]|nr:hypothetical protein [Elusimicrobiota bacterium]